MPYTMNPFTKKLDFFETSSSPSGDVQFLSGNSGGNVGPDGSGVVFVVGDNTEGINVVGDAPGNTLSIGFSASTDAPFAFLSDLNVGSVTPALGYDLNVQQDFNGPIGASINNVNSGSQAESVLWMQTDGSGANANISTVLFNANTSELWQYGMDASDSNSFKIARQPGFDAGTDTFRIDYTTGAVSIKGVSDAVQFTVKGNSAQTSNIFEIDNSSGSPLLEFTNSATLSVLGVINSDSYIQSDLFRQAAVGGDVAFNNVGTSTSGSSIGLTSSNGGITLTPASGKSVTVVNLAARDVTTDVTGTSQAMSANNAYIADNGALVTLSLPGTSSVGDYVQVMGFGAGGWRITQIAGQIIHLGSSATTIGAGGRLDSTNQYDSITMKCVVANTTWVTVSVIGSITVV